MTDGIVEVGQYLAIPFVPSLHRPHVNERILEGCVNLPLFPLPLTPDERRVAVAAHLTNPSNIAWEVWKNGDVRGIFLLSRVVPGLDALAHLAFFDRQLVGRHPLVRSMMAWAFRELRLQRLSVEIPDHLPPLIRFCRAKLGFRYEGEPAIATSQLALMLENAGINNPATYAAKLGSRRERAHFANGEWHDLITLRVLREEFTAWEASAKA